MRDGIDAGGALMFFYDDEMKIAEDLAWKMLDGWNHAYCPDLKEYAHFYYKGKVILDPWMNEESQGLPWPDHESKETAVDPVKYYGMNTIEDYLVNSFVLRPEWAPKITQRVKENLNDSGRLIHFDTIMPVEVYIAMTKEQADDEHGKCCIEWALPDSYRIYFDMMKLPPELITIVEEGWQREIVFLKKDAKKVFDLLYPDGIKFDYKKKLNRIYGKEVRLIGWGD